MSRILALLLFISLLAGCSYTMKIRDGKMAYERKQFAVATSMLKQDISKEKSRVEKGKLAYMLAASYDKLHEPANAIEWYQTAYDYGYGTEALKGMAYALKADEQYEEAKRAFKDLSIEIGSPYEYRREISACDVAIGWKKDERKEYSVELMPFNSGNADYAPTLFDGQLVFTSDRSASTGDDPYNWTGNDFSDLYTVNTDGGEVEPFDKKINTDFNEGTAVFSKNKQELFFTRCGTADEKIDAYCQIMYSEASGGGWTNPRPLEFQEDDVNYMHPALSEDGQELYFSSDHPDGSGGYDIYVSKRLPDGWDIPRMLGRSVNTPGNEQFPFMHADTLYFSSNQHTGMGGLDIFRTYRMGNGNWAPAYNLKDPINSGADDFGLVIDHKATNTGDIIQQGYFSSSRSSGIGQDDIYQFSKKVLPPEPEPEEPVVIEYKLILEGYLLEKIYQEANNPNSSVLGRKPLPGGKIRIQYNDKTEEIEVGEDGKFTLEMEENTDYSFLGSRSGYLNKDAYFSTKGIGKDPANPVQTYELEIVLDKVFLDQEIVLENIYYDFDKWDIREDAEPTLNELTEVLSLNPDIKIQLASHTDCRGNDRYNQQLSQKRAQSAVDYLINQGINSNRLSAVGYGEEQPAVDCVCNRCTEEEHQANRRTTFKIVE